MGTGVRMMLPTPRGMDGFRNSFWHPDTKIRAPYPVYLGSPATPLPGDMSFKQGQKILSK